MKTLKDLAQDMRHQEAIKVLAENRSISYNDAKAEISQLSFAEYHSLLEDGTAITPPSGNTIAPSTPTQAPATAPTGVKAIWPGKGAPVEQGMTVGLKGPDGMPVPGQISQVDQGAKGVKVKNPTTGQEEWTNIDALQPYMAGAQAGATTSANTGSSLPNTNGQDPNNISATMEDAQLMRLRELAGIKENCSAGATGAGAIAVAPAAMGGMKKRQATEEEVKKEYTPKRPPQTIVGDTKPGQATGELSSNLAVHGKKTASRINNGFKK